MIGNLILGGTAGVLRAEEARRASQMAASGLEEVS